MPKSIRLHHRILEAYREGWLPYLRKSPWRLWVPISQGLRRVYMSNGLLADDQVINALADGWRQLAADNIINYWFCKASERMRKLPALQVSMLRAICLNGLAGQNRETMKVYVNIEHQHNQLRDKKLKNIPFDKEIRSLLVRGIQVNEKT